MAVGGKNWIDRFFTSRDGLRLRVRHYPAPSASRRAVICLPGLTRNSADFHDLATVLSDPRGLFRHVYAVDYRGRGRSEASEDPAHYTVQHELADVLDFMALEGLHDVGVVGTSRGGLVAMAMASMRPSALGAVVLNDIGPVIERDGLARLVAYVGRIPLPNTWTEAEDLVRRLHVRAFPNETPQTWAGFTRQLFNDENGRPAPAYDPNLSKSLKLSDGPIPTIWPQFAALSRVPLLAFRGANSDILSAETLEEMRRRHPMMEAVTVPDQGHAPLFKDADTIGAIYQFLVRTDETVSLVVSPRPVMSA